MNKLKIKKQVYELFSNTDARVLTSKNKLRIKKPNIMVLKPKPGGLVVRELVDVDVMKQPIGLKIAVTQITQTVIYKQYP